MWTQSHHDGGWRVETRLGMSSLTGMRTPAAAASRIAGHLTLAVNI